MKQLQPKKILDILAIISVFFLVFVMPGAARADISPDVGLDDEEVIVEAEKTEKKEVVVVKKPVVKPAPVPKPKPKVEAPVKVVAASVVNPSTLNENVSIASKDVPPGLTPQIVSQALATTAGKAAAVTVKTLPGATCDINVYVVNRTPITAVGLETKTADADGICTWKWTVKAKTPKGSWGVQISASKDGVKDDTWTTLDIGNIH